MKKLNGCAIAAVVVFALNEPGNSTGKYTLSNPMRYARYTDQKVELKQEDLKAKIRAVSEPHVDNPVSLSYCTRFIETGLCGSLEPVYTVFGKMRLGTDRVSYGAALSKLRQKITDPAQYRGVADGYIGNDGKLKTAKEGDAMIQQALVGLLAGNSYLYAECGIDVLGTETVAPGRAEGAAAAEPGAGIALDETIVTRTALDDIRGKLVDLEEDGLVEVVEHIRVRAFPEADA
ncbi:MAG: hypothetical protein LBF66_00350 [Holosporales bacterium]|jgi:hypothetical protein|nr:hypothetical protein [Holosporales bacterium]